MKVVITKDNKIIEEVEIESVTEYQWFVENKFPELLATGFKVTVEGRIG